MPTSHRKNWYLLLCVLLDFSQQLKLSLPLNGPWCSPSFVTPVASLLLASITHLSFSLFGLLKFCVTGLTAWELGTSCAGRSRPSTSYWIAFTLLVLDMKLVSGVPYRLTLLQMTRLPRIRTIRTWSNPGQSEMTLYRWDGAMSRVCCGTMCLWKNWYSKNRISLINYI